MVTVPVAAYREGSEEHPGTVTNKKIMINQILDSRAMEGFPRIPQLKFHN